MRRLSAALAIAAATALAGAALAGCATTQTTARAPASVPSPTATLHSGEEHGIEEIAQPQGFVVRYGLTELHVRLHTYCYSGGCVDGFDPDPASVGDADELFVFLPVAGLDQLYASQAPAGDDCTGRSVESVVTELGDGWWSVRPAGPADEYRLDLFASGSAGDMAAAVLWSTPHDEPLPPVTSSVVVVADHDGEPDSYGVELYVQNLARTPAEATATITVTSAEGASHTFDATRVTGECQGEGTVSFNGPNADGRTAAALGDFPFTYRVELTLDGVTHVATATFAGGDDDLYRSLEFSPSLD